MPRHNSAEYRQASRVREAEQIKMDEEDKSRNARLEYSMDQKEREAEIVDQARAEREAKASAEEDKKTGEDYLLEQLTDAKEGSEESRIAEHAWDLYSNRDSASGISILWGEVAELDKPAVSRLLEEANLKDIISQFEESDE